MTVRWMLRERGFSYRWRVRSFLG